MTDNLQTAIDYLNNSVKLLQTAKHKNTSFSADLNMLYKVSW